MTVSVSYVGDCFVLNGKCSTVNYFEQYNSDTQSCWIHKQMCNFFEFQRKIDWVLLIDLTKCAVCCIFVKMDWVYGLNYLLNRTQIDATLIATIYMELL